MPEFIRVTDDVTPKREYSINADSFIEGVHNKVDKDAVSADGSPLPPKYKPEPLSGKSSGHKAESSKESS